MPNDDPINRYIPGTWAGSFTTFETDPHTRDLMSQQPNDRVDRREDGGLISGSYDSHQLTDTNVLGSYSVMCYGEVGEITNFALTDKNNKKKLELLFQALLLKCNSQGVTFLTIITNRELQNFWESLKPLAENYRIQFSIILR